MSATRCKYYLQGNCYYGSSCRFSHDQPHRSNNQSDYENQPRSNRNSSRSYYDTDGGRDYNDYNEYGHNYESKSKNANYNYNSRNNYNNQRNDYHNQRNDYKEDYDSSNHYGNQAHKQRNVKNYYKEDDNSQGRKYNSEYVYNTNNVPTSSNRYKNSDDQKHLHVSNVHDRVDDKKSILKHYENEIKTYQIHVQQLSMTNIWPFTCFHPIGHQYPIQPVGSLNFIDISFEEIRCDYYITKNVCADAGLIHKRMINDLLLKTQKQKEDILRFENHVQDDIISTFQKCEKSKASRFENSIHMDPSSYWDMSIRYLKMPENNKSELESFSFVPKKNNTNIKDEPQLKILMQTEVYGKIDNDAFAQDHFTDFIPIMPPPRKYCV